MDIVLQKSAVSGKITIPSDKSSGFAPSYLWQIWENRNWLLLNCLHTLPYLHSFYSPAKGSTP